MNIDGNARSWFCVFNNPEEHGFSGEPEQIAEQMAERWIDGNPQRTCAVAYCISAAGLKHCHAVFEDTKTMRFTVVQKLFPGMHIEPTKGNKEQSEDYINKRGKWEEKGESVLYIARRGEIKGCQGLRRDFEIIDDLIQSGHTPTEIMDTSFSFRRYETMIKRAYFDKRMKETPILRDLVVEWHCGESGSGKTYEYSNLCKQYGNDNVYLLTDYSKGGFDNYIGQPILCMDEFRGQMPFSLLMNYLDGYRVQIPCRYTNGYALWNKVYIFTVLPPERVYENMVQEHRFLDTFEQLKRRIDFVVYHHKIDDKYYAFKIPMSEYINYEDLKRRAEAAVLNESDIPDWCKGEVEQTSIFEGDSHDNSTGNG